MWNQTKQARLNEIAAELGPLVNMRADGISDTAYARLKSLNEEASALTTERDTYEKARSMSSYASPAEWDGSSNPGDPAPGAGSPWPAVDDPVGQAKGLPSVWDITDDQWAQMKWATDNRQGFRIEVKSGPAKRSWHSNVQKTKSAFSTTGSMSGGPYTGNIPPMVTPWAVAQAYEPTRAADYLWNVAMPGPAAVWYTATNGAEVGAVNELNTKIDVSPSMAGSQVVPQKIAGIYTFSFESELFTQGFGEASVQTLFTQNLQASLINQESLAIIGASTAGTNPLGGSYPVNYKFNGILNQSGLLTRAVGSDLPFVALAKAYADVRTGSAFADPTHVWVHPNTLTALRTIRDDQGRFMLDLQAGPSNLSALGQTAGPSTDREPFTRIPQGKNGYAGTLWGATIISTTHVPSGVAIVMNVPAGGGVVWHKTGLILQSDNGFSGSNFQNNAYSVRAEELFSVSIPRPTSCNVLTGLPTQAS